MEAIPFPPTLFSTKQQHGDDKVTRKEDICYLSNERLCLLPFNQEVTSVPPTRAPTTPQPHGCDPVGLDKQTLSQCL